jgi:hypothetical protein
MPGLDPGTVGRRRFYGQLSTYFAQRQGGSIAGLRYGLFLDHFPFFVALNFLRTFQIWALTARRSISRRYEVTFGSPACWCSVPVSLSERSVGPVSLSFFDPPRPLRGVRMIKSRIKLTGSNHEGERLSIIRGKDSQRALRPLQMILPVLLRKLFRRLARPLDAAAQLLAACRQQT